MVFCLTNCAACAAPLALDAPKCVRCKTRYCNATCRNDHWRRGHKQICKRIHRGGGAERYHADKKYKEAVAVAVEACAEDAKGHTCYICMEAVHSRTGEGLVRGCACKTTEGFAHVSCLVEQAKVLMDEAIEDNLGFEEEKERWLRWYNCCLCGQDYHGVVACALGWGCWKTYANSSSEVDRSDAIGCLGNGLFEVGQNKEAVALHAEEIHVGIESDHFLGARISMACCYAKMGRREESLKIEREVYAQRLASLGDSHKDTLSSAHRLGCDLVHMTDAHRIEARALMHEVVPRAAALGPENKLTLDLRWLYAFTLWTDPRGPTLDDLVEAVAIYEDVEKAWVRIFGEKHPDSLKLLREHAKARERLADARASSEQLALAALAFVAAVAFLAGRRYLRR